MDQAFDPIGKASTCKHAISHIELLSSGAYNKIYDFKKVITANKKKMEEYNHERSY